MRQAFDESEIEETEDGAEAEFTLGSTGLIIAFVALLLICAACFGIGYSIGHRSPSQATAIGVQPASSPDAPLLASASKQKPSAAPQPPPVAPSTGSVAADAPPADPDGDVVAPQGRPQAPGSSTLTGSPQVADPASSQPAQPSAPGPGQLAVKPALPQQQPAQPLGAAHAPLMPPANALMVQIAAVSHAEDADVLLNALRRRGYAVSVRRDPLDNLIHVQVGPFANRNDANAMRLKLLNDGYNAIVQP